MWNVEGAIGGPLTDRWSARASVLYQRRDDWVDNTYPGPNDGFEGYDESAARVQFLYEGDALEAMLNLHRRNMRTEERRVGKECCRTGKSRGGRHHTKK